MAYTLTTFIKSENEVKICFKINGDENTIMGLPINKIKEYLNNYK